MTTDLFLWHMVFFILLVGAGILVMERVHKMASSSSYSIDAGFCLGTIIAVCIVFFLSFLFSTTIYSNAISSRECKVTQVAELNIDSEKLDSAEITQLMIDVC